MRGNAEMKRPLKNKVIGAVLLICLLIDFGCVTFNYRKYVSINRDYTAQLASTVINTCCLVIDGDKVEDYLNTRKRDSDYYVVWNKLIDYRNTNPDIVKLSVMSFQEDGCYYIFDTDLTEKGAFLGDSRPYDPWQLTARDSLLNYSSDVFLVYRDHTDIYIPIKSSYNIPVAYVVAGVATDTMRAEQRRYLLYLVLIITGITVFAGALLLLFMDKNILAPVNAMTAAAESYGEKREKDGEISPLQKLQVRTGDELERLCESMKKMENDILAYSARLISATWNSNHDSMTQLFNKRYYNELLTALQEQENLGVIYLDIDNLKKMNDTFGHDEGDLAILRASALIHRYEEPGFECCRVGGDEFVIFLRNAGERVEDLVNCMRGDKGNLLSEITEEFICRLAVGGASRKAGETLEDVIKRAEEEMYRNKHAIR